MRKGTGFITAVILLLQVAVVGSAGQKPSPQIGISNQKADAILEELRAIREMISAAISGGAVRPQINVPQTTATKTFTFDDLPAIGSPNAGVTMVEFFDYQCPFCRDFHLSTFESIRSKYVESGRLRFVSVDLPLPMHENASRAAEAAQCGGDQGKFWDMRDLFLRNPGRLGPEDLIAIVGELHINTQRFRDCLESARYRAKILAESRRATSIGINVTPSFIVGRSAANVVAGPLIAGAQPLAVFEAAIRSAEEQR
jgi:hypothetical protein